MTLQTTDNTATYFGDGVVTSFPYTFRVDQNSDMVVTQNGLQLTEVQHYTLTGIGEDVGGSVDLVTAPAAGDRMVLARIVPTTQDTRYPDGGPFPAASHEAALDKLTMIAQQNAESANRNLRLPLGDSGLVVFPHVDDRAEKYAYFDINGDVGVVAIDPTPVPLLSLSIADDSVDMLLAEYLSDGPQRPRIGARNINGPNGLMQLTEQGTIPNSLIDFVGLQLRGVYRGDDLCDKPGDEVGDCTAPDVRNPSQRLPEIVSSLENGDYFIITLEAPEVVGTMNLFANIGDATTTVLTVTARDGILYLEEITDPDDGTILTYAGWYHIPNLVETGDASFIDYDPTGNTYLLGNNVQVALDQADADLITRDGFYLTQKNANRIALPTASVSAITSTGFYVSTDVNDPSLPTVHAYSITHTQVRADAAVQLANREDIDEMYTRRFTSGAWEAWSRLAKASEIPVVPAQPTAEDLGIYSGQIAVGLTTIQRGGPISSTWSVITEANTLHVGHTLGHGNFVVTANGVSDIVGEFSEVMELTGGHSSVNFSLQSPSAANPVINFIVAAI